MKKLIYLTALVLIIGACQKDEEKVAPEKIYLELFTEYVTSTDEVFVRAVFHKEVQTGDIVDIYGDASIYANGQEMKQKATDPYGYSTTIPGFQETLTVTYTDSDGSVYENNIDMTAVAPISIPSSFDNLNVNEDHDLVWNGAAISENNERVVLEYGDSGLSYYRNTQSDLEAHSLTVSSRNLMTFGPSTIDMILKRELSFVMENQPPSGGTILSAYSTGRVSVRLIYE